MWDVQTGGLIHTFTTQSKINDIAVSTTHIACGLAGGPVTFWGIHTREKGKNFWKGKPIVAICWLSTQVLAVATQTDVDIHDIIVDKSSIWFSTHYRIWGMVHSEGELLVGTLGEYTNYSFFKPIRYTHTLQPRLCEESWVYDGKLKNPTLVGEEIACISPTTGVWLFDPSSTGPPCHLTKNPSLLRAARSLAVSLGRNIIIQTDDSIQIFSSDVLMSGEAHEKSMHLSHVYPLGKKHIICVKSDRCLIVLELETLKEFCPDNLLWSLLGRGSDQSPFAGASLCHGVIAEVGILQAMELWKSGTEIPKCKGGKNVPLTGLSPMCTLDVSLLSSNWSGFG